MGLLLRIGEGAGKHPWYISNGFFMAMRSRFIKLGTSLHIYVVEWESSAPSWADFCGKVLGPTDPAEAPAALYVARSWPSGRSVA